MNNQTQTKICKSCGEPFPAVDYWGKEYCTLRCRNREKRHRHRARDLNLTMKVESRYFTEVANPTVAQLDAYATMVLKEQTDEKPVRFFGTCPHWLAPEGVIFVKSEGIDQDEWLMFHPAMLDDE
jgi:hypothetical protein